MTAHHPTGHDDSLHHARAGEDEWGLFDPERHGIAAVRARLGVVAPAAEPSTADAASRHRQSPRPFADEE
jgi:hypothetical protein